MRADAEYYQPHYLVYEALFRDCPTVDALTSHILHPVEVKREYVEEGIQILLAQNIRGNRLDLSEPAYMSADLSTELRRNLLETGDVVVTRSGVNYGDTAPYLGVPAPLYASADCLVLRPTKISGEYLATFFNTCYGRELMKRGAYGTAQPHIAPTYISELRVYTNRDVEREVNKLLTQSQERMEESKRLYRQAEQLLLDELGLSDLELSAGLNNDAPISKVWESHRIDAEYYQPRYEYLDRAIQSASATVKPLGSLIHPIINGFDWRDFVEDGTPYIRVGDVYKDWIDLDNAFRVAISPEEVGKPVGLQVGDILFTRKGTFGQAAVVDERASSALISSEIMRLRLLDPLAVHPQYLSLYLNSVLGYTQVERRVHGAGFYSISQEDLGQILICVPGWETQKKIADKVAKSHAACHQAKAFLEQAKRKVEMMIQSEAAHG